MPNQSPLLEVKDLVIEFQTEKGLIRAVDGVSFTIDEGETIGLVGESGCGKSITSLSLLGLVPSPPGRYGQGSSIKFRGRELIGQSEADWRKMRGRDISMIFQEPMTALNPVFKIGTQMADVLRRHRGLSKAKAWQESIELLTLVGIPSPEKRLNDYPHQLSGGMRQRVMIAMALSCDPALLLADEPTTALDVTVQAQVMEQMSALQKERGMATILVTHDLAVVAEFCKKVMVMYCGKIVEVSNVYDLFDHPKHPYTKGLLEAIPKIRDHPLERLPTIKGSVPDLHALPRGCRFYERCFRAKGDCEKAEPPLELFDQQKHHVACYHPV